MNFNFTLETVFIFIFLISFLSTYILIHKLNGIVYGKNLLDNLNLRSSNIEKTQTLVIAVLFLSFIFRLFAIHYFKFHGFSLIIIFVLTILFFVGIKDGLMLLSVKKKSWEKIISFRFVLIRLDGVYLSSYLLKKNDIVHGLKRRASLFYAKRIDYLYQNLHIENQYLT